MVRVRVIHPDDVQPVPVEPLLRAAERVRVDEVPVPGRIAARIGKRDELHRDEPRSVRQPADEAAGLVRVVRLAVPADGRHVAGLEHQGHAASPASRRRSLR